MVICRIAWIGACLAWSISLSEAALHAEVLLIAPGNKTVWRYLDGGNAPAKPWIDQAFDDSKWKQGPAPLGYGEDKLGTKLSFGSSAEKKPITCYFRTKFTVDKQVREKIKHLGLRLRRDDGAIVYINGKEIVRNNLPVGPISSATLATQALSGIQEQEYQIHQVSAAVLTADGTNVVAVEVHQASAESSDLYLDLEIKGYLPGEVPKRDFFREGMTAAALGDYETSAKLLGQLDPNHSNYAKATAFLAHQIYARSLKRASDGLPFARKAYEAAPQDREVVRAFIKTHVLSGVLFDDKTLIRTRKKTVAPEHRFIVSKPDLGDNSPKLGRAELEQDLDYLEHVLVHCFAYLELRPVDYRGALDAIRLMLDKEMSVNAFELCIAKFITLFCDGHASTSHHPTQYLPRGYAPYAAGEYQNRVYLINQAGSGFLDAEHPYVAEIDGKPIAEWIKVAGYLVVKESAHWHRRQALANLRYVNYLRGELKLPRTDEIELRLESKDRKRSRKMTVRVQPGLKPFPAFPRGASRRIGDFGYLRIPSMTSSPRFLADIEQWMERFRDTEGLIIDVRGNGGGTKEVLFTLFPYFEKPGAPLRVVELSTYRKPMELPQSYRSGFMMSTMSAQPLTSTRWKDDAERRQIHEFLQGFKPQWPLPAGKFSEWHVLALNSQINPRAYYYDKPLIVLQDSGTFSAGDIFVGAFEDHPRATLMGGASGGGNGWMESYVLPKSRLNVVLCQSAKFRPNGKPYDGEGIPADVVLEATPRDVFGETDTVIDAAIRRLEKSTPGKRARRREAGRQP